MILTTALCLVALQTPQIEAGKPSAEPPAQQPPAAQTGPKLQTLHLGESRAVTGYVLKETADAVIVDLGWDVLRVPVASIVRRSQPKASSATRIKDFGLFRTAERPERSVSDGAADVGPAVVKIESPAGQGSGFITSPDGYVVTNFHVTEGEVEVDVILYLRDAKGQFDTRTLRKVKVIAVNPVIDLALLKIDVPKDLTLPFVFMGKTATVEVGDPIYAIGAPIGLDRTVSSGIVSVTNRAFGGHTMLQMTVPINPGNSGGPLFNMRGEVVGVNSAGYTGMQGLNFAIPAKYVKDFLTNHDAFAVDRSRSENGIHVLPAPGKPKQGKGESGS